MWNKLGDKLSSVVKKSFSKTHLTEDDINTGLRQIKLSLLEADVHLKVVKEFINSIKEKLVDQVKLGSLNASETIMKLIYDELVTVLGKENKKLIINKKPSIHMFVGLQGTGKTTSVAKLALYLRQKHHKKVLLVAADIYRPAAIDQLVQLGKQLGIDVLEKENVKEVDELCSYGLEIARKYNYDVVIFDTAGRLTLDDRLMDELSRIKEKTNPDEIILTLDATSGQDVLTAAEAFHKKLNITSAILSKMDYDAKGGGALSLSSLLNIPIKFIGVGEKPKDFEIFYPDRMAKRILDYGDIETLSEKAKEVMDEKNAKKSIRKLVSGNFDLNDFLDQLKQLKKLDKLSGVLKMLPAFRKMNISDDMLSNMDTKMKVFETIIFAMTNEERKDPKLLKDPSRKARIIRGSGRTAQEFNTLINNWNNAKDKMKSIKQNKGMAMGGKFKPPF